MGAYTLNSRGGQCLIDARGDNLVALVKLVYFAVR